MSKNTPLVAEEVIGEFCAYAKRRGVLASTAAKAVFGNFYALDRLGRRAAKVQRDLKALREYMASNPLTPDVLACADKDTPDAGTVQPTQKVKP